MDKLHPRKERKKASFSTLAYYFFLRARLQLFARIAPRYAAKISVNVFTKPAMARIGSKDAWPSSITNLKQERLPVSGASIAIYLIGTSPRRVLLCHGWGGAAAQFSDLVAALVARGFSVMAFDAPAHGASEGERTDIIEFGDVINAVISVYGVPYGIVGHSFGAAGVAYALHKFDIRTERCVLISTFGTAAWTFENFGRILGLSKHVVDEMRRITATKHAKTEALWQEFDVGEFVARSKVPTMLIHDQDDREIPYDEATYIVEKCDSSLKFVSTTGLGHRRIVRDSMVVDLVTEFMCPAPEVLSALALP